MRIGIPALALVLTLSGCASQAPEQRELVIGPAPVACAGAPAATCLEATEPSGDTWLMEFDEIDGFAYEPGYTYRILIEEPPLKDELAVTPRLQMVRVVSEQPAGNDTEPGPLGRAEWRLQSITSSAASARDWSGSEITLQVADGWVDGFGGCNPYLAAATVDGQKITISEPATTLEECADSVEDRQQTYLEALAKAQAYTVAGDRLGLTLSDGGAMQFRAAPG